MTMPTTFGIRGKLLLGTHLEPGTLIVKHGRIASVRRGTARDGDLPTTIYEADIVTPGLIDMQVNGGWGREASADPRDVDHISREMLPTGVTAWLPTIVTSPASAYPPLFEAWPGHDPDAGAVPLGYHLEGPFLTLEKKGAHNPQHILAAPDELIDLWAGQESVALVTLSPERELNLARIQRLADAGILVSLGHTNATFEQFVAGVDAGARMATHLFNAMTPIHHREPGAMVASLVDDRVVTGLIADGIHSHPAMVRLAIRAKGVDGIAIVTDMMAACGLGPGTYPLGSMEVTVTEGSARLPDGTLAGSMLTMDQALRNLVEWSDVTPAEAFHMMAAVPARLLGDTTRGSLVSGARADLALWGDDLTARGVFVGGRSMWQRDA